jgi:hypothetical protein
VPGYFSLGVLRLNDYNLNVKYLTYWVVFSVTEIVGFVFEYAMGPMAYVVARVLLVALLLHPSVELSHKIYQRIVVPAMSRYEGRLD